MRKRVILGESARRTGYSFKMRYYCYLNKKHCTAHVPLPVPVPRCTCTAAELKTHTVRMHPAAVVLVCRLKEITCLLASAVFCPFLFCVLFFALFPRQIMNQPAQMCTLLKSMYVEQTSVSKVIIYGVRAKTTI